MKRILTIAAIAAAAVCMLASCKPSTAKTVDNLKTAIDAEATSSAMYAAFAEKATEDGYPEITALFQAAAEAENSLVKNYQGVLTQLGIEDYTPVVSEFKVDSTAANLQVAMDAAKYGNEIMYPELMKTIEGEKVENAVLYMNYAKEAQGANYMVYNSTLQFLNDGAVIPAAYFVCPKCGVMFAGEAPQQCRICMASESEFLGFHAVMPLMEVAQPLLRVEPLKLRN